MADSQSAHQVIARKWRPQKFSDVVGQTHVIRTLRNAIANDRVGHAYLLVGPRGIGKTTIARIFAKAINCEHPQAGEPCCECASCRAIAEENSLDVIEIDAASRNSVDHMRALSEEAFHMPVASKYKIYIIDEVHMLSKSAWNALLKTVEEPPSHVKFIFATTEAHLVLPTIVSRCQRFDLRPIPGNLILERLKLIAESEHVAIAPEALQAIARAAEGGMRDAQSSLEQMFSFFGGPDQEIKTDQVLELFGLAKAAELDELLQALLTNHPETVVRSINVLAQRGRNLETLFDDLLEMLRGAELSRMLQNPESVLDFDEEKLERCRKLAQMGTPEMLRSFMESLTPVGRILHEALNKAIYLESILLKAMHDAHAPTLGDVLARLNQLRSAGELEYLKQLPSFQSVPPVPMATQTIPASQPEPPAPVVKAEAKVEAASQEKAETSSPKNPEPQAETPEVKTETTQVPEVAEVPQELPAQETLQSPPTPQTPRKMSAEELFTELQRAIAAENLACSLEGCSLFGLTNSVLSLQVPRESWNDLHENRWKILSILQKITQDWTMLLDLQPAAETKTEPPAPIAEPAETPMEESVMEEVCTAEENPEAVLEQAEGAFTSTVPLPEVPDVEENFSEVRSNLEPTAWKSETSVSPEPLSCAEAEQEGVKRSIVHRPEEVEATAKMPAVQAVLKLFDGEIVDIHA